MGTFLIFIAALLVLSINGLLVWWIWCRIYITVKRRESVFDIEKETHKKIKKQIQEEKEE